eukprot:Unigene4803_Nuclearia_a/m.14686 Unigene4803_Nuclearia_a/g.14686  ORF Unigene4803_Nuclearia_a/g.14686 Unigene4803_Nuclearia_a/m.14686 type:complete len:469 (+) Unigene4803_Nuclearia_a:18-1424(+)
MGWAEPFWAGAGYDVLLKHMRNGSESTKAATKVLHEKAALDADFAKGLGKLSKSIAALAKDDFGTMKQFWDNMRLEIDNQAKLFQQIATSIENDIVKALESFRDEQLKTRANLDKKYLASEKSYSTAKGIEQKARKAAHSAGKSCEAAAEAHSRAQGNEKEAAKTEKVYQKARKDAEAADKDYRATVRKVHETKLTWESNFLMCCLEYQAQDQARIAHLRADLEKFADIHLSVLPQVADSHQKIRSDTAQIDEVADIEAAAQQKGTGTQRPDDVMYQSYALDMKNPMAPQRRGELLAQTIAELEQDLASQQKGLAGIENLLKVYTDQPSFADNTTRITSEHQLNSIKEYMEKIRTLIGQYEQALSSCGGSRSAYPVSVASSAGGGGFSSAGYDEPSDYAPSAPSAAGAAGGVSGKCRAMYDFDASNEGELSVREGEVLTIVSMDDPEWITVQSKAGQGYVPVTYVEMM